jgi:hypothetical protein
MNKILKFWPGRSRMLLAAAMLLVPTLVLFGGWGNAKAQTMNGFDLSQAEVPLSEIHRGGPPRDGIPALNDPEFLRAGDAPWLRDDDRVLGVRVGELARAYPFSAFPETGRHRIEDELGGESLAILIDADAQSGRVLDARGEEIPSLTVFWFAWFAFHPDTDWYEPAR